jgi:Na+-driven multidrug efflux pump
MVFSLSNLVIQSAINSLGAAVMAASAAAFNIEILAYFVMNAFGQVTSTFIGQNYGARNLDRCKQIARICMFQSISVNVILSGLIIYFCEPLLRIFNSDAEVIAYGSIRVIYIIAPGFLNTILEILSGIMRGYGNSLIPAIVALLGICGARIIYVYTIFMMDPTMETLMKVFPLSWFITDVVLAVAYFKFVNYIAKHN